MERPHEMKKIRIAVLALLASILLAPLAFTAQETASLFPDIPPGALGGLGYKTLKCDLHMHTVFSDGEVWPTVRVDEAVREGLDAIAITDHIEYQPYKEDVPTNFNRPFEIAAEPAKKKGILLIKGAEITRDTPPGHFNAIFLEDIKPLDTNDLPVAVKAANDQDAFVFWNHPGWKPDKKGWFDIHTQLYENKWLHGIEVANGEDYYADAHKWCLEKTLTMLGNSDIHTPSLITQTTPDNHRTMTLVFAEEKTPEALKEALAEGRTAVWCKNQLIGKEDFLDAIFKASVKVGDIKRKGRRTFNLEIVNNCALNIQLQRLGDVGPAELLLPAMGTAVVQARLPKGAKRIELSYVAKNLLIAPENGLPVKLSAPIQQAQQNKPARRT